MQFEIIPVTPFEQNCSLIWDRAGRAAFVDPGGEAERLLAQAAKRGLTVEKLLLTHGHLDHVGAAAELRARLKVPIEGPQREDAFWLDALPEQARLFGLEDSEALVPDRWLNDCDSVQVGDLTLDVLHCPGHTPGHVVFHHAAGRLAFVGDVLFRGSIGRSDFPRGNHAALLRCIRGKLWPLGDATRFVPGHGPMSTFGEERRSNPFVQAA